MSTILKINLKIEEEISELSEEERRELEVGSQLDQLILACYNMLNLITFYTVAGGEETRAWTLKKGEDVLTAAQIVHSDFREQFKKAEVINWEKLVEAGSRLERGEARPGAAWAKAREKGLIQTAGKDYIVQDGDVIEFKI